MDGRRGETIKGWMSTSWITAVMLTTTTTAIIRSSRGAAIVDSDHHLPQCYRSLHPSYRVKNRPDKGFHICQSGDAGVDKIGTAPINHPLHWQIGDCLITVTTDANDGLLQLDSRWLLVQPHLFELLHSHVRLETNTSCDILNDSTININFGA